MYSLCVSTTLAMRPSRELFVKTGVLICVLLHIGRLAPRQAFWIAAGQLAWQLSWPFQTQALLAAQHHAVAARSLIRSP